MREAFALLNKSIIRVEQPDINLEETEEAVEVPAVDGTAAATPMEVDGVRFYICVNCVVVLVSRYAFLS